MDLVEVLVPELHEVSHHIVSDLLVNARVQDSCIAIAQQGERGRTI